MVLHEVCILNCYGHRGPRRCRTGNGGVIIVIACPLYLCDPERGQHLDHYIARAFHGEWAAAQCLRQSLAFDVFHHYKHSPIVCNARLVNPGYVRMSELRSGAGLGQKAIGGVAGIGGEFDRDPALEEGVLSEIDFSLTAAAQQLVNNVMADSLALNSPIVCHLRGMQSVKAFIWSKPFAR